ncbi:MAG: helix-turn-helix transcriptional regulator [Myxococcota bacterium]|nr:helix-turn-helix transcriptional regulator [Myxococcota bacterium]
MDEPSDAEQAEDVRTEAFGPGLGRAIRVIRAGLDMSRKELAERTGLSRSYVAEIENDRKTPSSRALAALAAGLGVEPRGLLEAAERWENEPPPHSYETLLRGATSFETNQIPDTSQRRIRGATRAQLRSASSRRALLRDLRQRAAASGEAEELTALYRYGLPAPPESSAESGAAEGDRDALGDASEVLELFSRLDAEDRERVLDLARRLAGE